LGRGILLLAPQGLIPEPPGLLVIGIRDKQLVQQIQCPAILALAYVFLGNLEGIMPDRGGFPRFKHKKKPSPYEEEQEEPQTGSDKHLFIVPVFAFSHVSFSLLFFLVFCL
jgi:hypothetical protein